MTTVAIMQPTYLPWCGYFDLLDQADVFVLLDTVAVSKQSWQTRNRIRARDGNVVWLSVPTNATPRMPLDEVSIAGLEWWKKHRRTLYNALGHAPYWGEVEELFTKWNGWVIPPALLASFTSAIIRTLAASLGVETKIMYASVLERVFPLGTDPIERLARICAFHKADEYLSPIGAKDYLDGHDIRVPVRWHNYEHPTYSQGDAPFMPFLSVVDLLAWHGPASLDIIRSGRR